MKTVWIVNHYATDPQETASGSRHFSLARGLVQRGWTVVLLAASTEHPSGRRRAGIPDERASDRIRDGVRFRFLRTPQYDGGLGRLRNMAAFTAALLRRANVADLPRPDVVIGSTVHPLAAWAASVLARRAGVPFLFEIRDLWPQTLIDMGKLSPRSPLSWMLRRLERMLCDRAEAVITLLPFASEYLVAQGVPAEKVVWISNGTDADDFDGAPPPGGDDFVFMYLGSVGRANGLSAIVDGFLSAAATEPRLRLVIVGTGTELPAIRTRAGGSPQGVRVTFEPPVPKDQVPILVGRADAMVINILDLDVYRFGVSMNKIFDYAAAARPILVASNARNNVVTEADAGIVVPADDAEALGVAMIRMASRDAADDRARWAANARAHVMNHYDYRALAEQLDHVLERCVTREGDKQR
ncbi:MULTISPECIES: glycosyltransferase family 4 protein [Microbacterium]|uniref:glycosyltransferase family 4 protein n=1 Tax=Microbacterium TaxID=33882 RepID=UPI0011EB7CEF|nr:MULTISPECIES: glycosyltransferase family 4 protein [Microbacterium]